ncbi:MAG: hypothetical protein V4539_01305 [Bacteroidota bacterium]
MKKLFVILILFSAAACSKVSNHQIRHSAEPFFKNAEEANALVKSVIQKLHLKGEFTSIEHVTYLQSGKSAFAFIFYASTCGTKSMVAQKTMTDDESVGFPSVTVCQDGSCDCKVKAILNSDGDIGIGCSCNSCRVVTTGL